MFPQPEIAPLQPALTHAEFLTEYIEVLKPAGIIERNLAEAIAENAWCLKRVRLAEEKLLASAPDEIDAFLANDKQFRTLSLYEQRVQRILERNIALLGKLRDNGQARRDKALEEAKLLAQQNYLKDRPYDPTYDFPPEKGFTFTSAEINASIRRDHRVREAKQNDKFGFDPSRSRDRYRLNIIDNPQPGEPVSYDPTLKYPPNPLFDPFLLSCPSSEEIMNT